MKFNEKNKIQRKKILKLTIKKEVKKKRKKQNPSKKNIKIIKKNKC